MDEADASFTPSLGNGQPVQTPANETTNADADNIMETKEANEAPRTNAESLSSLLGHHILRFLETADNQVLFASFGALALLTYLLLGRLGILFIGLVSGFLLHDYWEGIAYYGTRYRERHTLNCPRRQELGIEVASRLLDWTSQKLTVEMDSDTIARVDDADISVDKSRFRPASAAAISDLIDAILRDYVNYWYKPILPSEDSFPLACKKALIGFVNALSIHMTRKRSADTFLQFVMNSSSMIIVFLNELSLALQATSSEPSSIEDYVKEYLKKYPDSRLANVLSIDQQQKKLNMAADDMLSNFLEPTLYKCDVVRNFLREMLAGVVFESVVQSCSHADFINGWIVYLLKEGEPEIMNAIDAGLESASKGDIAALSGIAGHASQDLAKAVPNRASRGHEKKHSHAEQEAASLNKSIRVESDLTEDLPQETQSIASLNGNGSLAEESMPGATISQSEEHFSSNGQRTQPQQPMENKIYEQNNLSETKNTEYGEAEDAIQILYGASVIVDDSSLPGDKTTMKAKPTTEYMLQIEPASTRYPGWMIFKKYQDFERLHEALATLSRYHHVPFLESHPNLPAYRDQTKFSLAKALERYLRDALEYKELAKSERLRRFLDKENEFGQTAPAKSGLSLRASNTLENMGKGMLGVLSGAPKGVAGGSKVVLDGVSGVLAGVNRGRKIVDITSNQPRRSLQVNDSNDTLNNIQEFLNHPTPPYNSSQEGTTPPEADQQSKKSSSSISDVSATDKGERGPAGDSVEQSSIKNVPTSPGSSAAPSLRKASIDTEATRSADGIVPQETIDESTALGKEPIDHHPPPSEIPITEDETRIAVELIFAVINELYTLSSAWNIRKTLLNAAKSYVLRPGNPHVESIRALVQESMIDAHLTDEAIATNITKLRLNSLPTDEELKSWPSPPSKDESEKLRMEARKLLIERGMPQVLMSVMGAAASGEALGKVFDSLQVEEVGRGFMFALILQALRAVIL